ncbi:MAG TPA: ATP-dependent Clp protease adaptor ClpS [Vicinamibacterales bacterium]|nr:ATP-dependent Clp protease adaptor ClpS [Vicinamibacterales bacterium]
MADETRQPGSGTLERTKPDVREPVLYKVVLHNDDYTTMEFVIRILEEVFLKPPAEAYRIMMAVHTQGRGQCGVYPFEIAETKVATVHDLAREHGFPLRASAEPE